MKRYTIPEITAALRVAYTPFSVYIRLCREFGRPKEEIDALVENRNFLCGVIDDLESKNQWRLDRPAWSPTPSESLAITEVLDAKRRENGDRLYQAEMFAANDAVKAAVALGILIPRNQALVETLAASQSMDPASTKGTK